MKLNILYIFTIVVLIFTACEKEDETTNDEFGTVETGRLKTIEEFFLDDLVIPTYLKTEYEYTNGKVSKIVNYYKDGDWTLAGYQTVAYYNDSIVITKPNYSDNRYAYRFYDGSNPYKNVYLISNGKTSQINKYTQYGDSWILNSKVIYTYSNNLIIEINHLYENLVSEWVPRKKTIYNYSGDNLTSMINYSYNPDVETGFSEEESMNFVYSDNRLTEILNNSDYSNTKNKLIYNGTKVKKTELYTFNSYDDSWSKWQYSDFSYNSSNALIKTTNYWLQEENYINSGSNTYTYESGDQNWSEIYDITATPESKILNTVYGY